MDKVARAAKRNAKLKPFTAYLLNDATDTYEGSLHHRRSSAESEKRDQSFLRDAKWRISKVRVTPL